MHLLRPLALAMALALAAVLAAPAAADAAILGPTRPPHHRPTAVERACNHWPSYSTMRARCLARYGAQLPRLPERPR